ncbi:SPOR domain-containing protein [Labilibacter sediminis]|nr:SPOR domain-containing protein [Labilibacter sediminis]
MLNLEKHINDLLYLYDCVIVPGLGGFVANMQSAELNEKTGVFSPPRREIGFNLSLSHNDGLLINHIASKEGLSFEDCLEKISKHINVLKYQLNCGDSIHIGEAGYLKDDTIGNTIFVPKNEQSFCPDSFGLSKFQFNTLEQLKEQKEPRRQLVRRTIGSKSMRQIAASVTLILGLLFVSPEFENHSQQSGFSDFFLSNNHTSVTIKSNESENLETEEIIVEEPAITVEVPEIKNKYFIIGGSFKDQQPAEVFLSRLIRKGIAEAEIIKSTNNRYRVSLSSFADKTEATLALKKFRKQNGYSSAWLLTQE